MYPRLLPRLLVVCAAVGLAPNLILPALPQMAEDFGVSYGEIQYAMSLYYAANGVLQLAIGPLADYFGRKPMLMAALALYAISSLGCGLSTNITAFLLFRTLQAVAFSGAVICRAIARETRNENEAVSAIAYISMAIALTNMLSPALGGFIVSELNWRANNFLTAVLGTGTLAMVAFSVPETGGKSGNTVRRQIHAFARLGTSLAFWAHGFVIAFSAGTYFAYLGGIAIVATTAFGLEPKTVGLLFGISSIGYLIGSFTSSRLTRRIGNQRLIVVGTGTTTAALAISLTLFLAGSGGVVTYYSSVLFVGFGFGMTIPNATVGLLTIGSGSMASAAGTSGALMVFTGAVLISISGMVTSHYQTAESLLLVQLGSSLLSLCAVAAILLLRLPRPPLG